MPQESTTRLTPPARPLCAQSSTSPCAYKASGNHPNPSEVKKLKQRDQNIELSNEMKDNWVGPMDPLNFLTEFLPINNDDMNAQPKSHNSFRSMWGITVASEHTMYPAFDNAVKPFAPGITFWDTHVNPDRGGQAYRHDFCVDETMDFSKMSTFLKFKYNQAHDPFNDTGKLFQREADEHMQRRGQISSYGAAISGSQFRIHVFSVSIYGEFARFIRWDRSGAIVSSSFSYFKSPKLLADFFWRYSHLDPRHQGYDPTVSIPSKAEKKKAKAAFDAKNKCYNKDFRKIMVPDVNDPKVEKAFIIPFPLQYRTRSPFSRATRTTVAYDLETEGLVFMKDYWRPDIASIEKEGDIYTILHNHKVPNITLFGTGNDVRDHITRTQEFVNQDWVRHRQSALVLMPLRNYRMTLLAIGDPLITLKSSKQMVSAIMDAMKVHDGAYFKARILHRDISVGNITIYGKIGLLIDWDMCTKVGPKLVPEPRQSIRTGTWQFMSALILSDPPKHVHDIEDDRESAFYVMLWTAMRYTKHTASTTFPGQVSSEQIIRAFDEALPDGSGNCIGGSTKCALLSGGIRPKFDNCPQLDGLIQALCRAFSIRYNIRTRDEVEAKKPLRTENWLVQLMQGFLDADGWL